MTDLYDAAASLRSTLSHPDPQEVVVVRPRKKWTDVVGTLIGSIIALFIRGALLSFVATQISFVPDFGFWESFWIGVAAVWLFHNGGSSHVNWTKGWSQRYGAARDLFAKKKGA